MEVHFRIAVFKSANYVRTELPIRIAHRLQDLQALPYIVVTQESVAKVYEVRSVSLASPLVVYFAISFTGQLLKSGL